MIRSLALFCLALLVTSPTEAADRWQGMARVISGDTLEVQGERLRLHGIVAPKLGQPCQWPNKTIDCGNISRTGLLDLIAPVAVACRRITTAKDGTPLVLCTAEGFDVGRNMVHTGWALAAPGDPAGYLATQRKAEAGKRGVWRGSFTLPWEWQK